MYANPPPPPCAPPRLCESSDSLVFSEFLVSWNLVIITVDSQMQQILQYTYDIYTEGQTIDFQSVLFLLYHPRF